MMSLLLSGDSPVVDTIWGTQPATMDISAVRYIDCKDSIEGEYTGSGFLIGDHILATAYHIASGAKCTDVLTGTPLKTYATDPKHDFALMTGPGLPTDIPYVKYSCSRFIPGQPYISYGISDYMTMKPIVRDNTIYATENMTSNDYEIEGTPSPGMRVFKGFIAPGMSGGPVTDLEGKAHGVNNAGNRNSTIIYELTDTILCKVNTSK